MSIEIRPIAPEEFEPFWTANGTGFGYVPNLAQMDESRELLEYDRTLASFDGEEIVSTTAIDTFDMTVPGGALPAAGVTWVSVKPTHRRRGVLTGMMRRQLRDVRERNEPLAALWASESIIYSRYGYGLASEGTAFEIEREHTAYAVQPLAPGRCRLVAHEEALATWPGVYARVLPRIPGMYTRHEAWWRCHSMRQHEWGLPSGFSGRFYVQYEEDGEALGYAKYRLRGDQSSMLPNATLAVQELIAASDGAYAALWTYIFGVDLVGTIVARHRPVDEPLTWMLADPRRLQRRIYDVLWVRIVDVVPALEGRRYATEGRVVFDVRDGFCDWVEGRYELEGGPDGARCKRTGAEADVSLSAADLGAVYMGGMRLSALRRAGRIEGDDKAIAYADAMLSWDPRPWCPEVF